MDVDFVIPLHEVIDRTVKLAQAFRRRNWLVVNVKVPNVYGIKLMNEGTQPGGRVERGYVRPPGNAESWLGESWHDFVPELQPHPEDLVIVKPFWDSFIGTTLDYDLRQQGVTQVFVTGLIAHVGVESTARVVALTVIISGVGLFTSFYWLVAVAHGAVYTPSWSYECAQDMFYGEAVIITVITVVAIIGTALAALPNSKTTRPQKQADAPA